MEKALGPQSKTPVSLFRFPVFSYPPNKKSSITKYDPSEHKQTKLHSINGELNCLVKVFVCHGFGEMISFIFAKIVEKPAVSRF